MSSSNDLIELTEFLKRGIDKSTLSQIIIPFCSDTSGERAPVAFLSGNIDLKTSLKKNNEPIILEDEVRILEAQIANKKLHSKGQVIDLSNEIKRLQIESFPNDSDVKEIEIKEEWTVEDEKFISMRKSRANVINNKPNSNSSVIENNKTLDEDIDEDIDELLRRAELEEEQEELTSSKAPSKIAEIKKEFNSTKHAKDSSLNRFRHMSKTNLPKINTTNPLVGEVIERTSEEPRKPSHFHDQNDQVSSRIILNDLIKLNLKSSSFENIKEFEDESGNNLDEKDTQVQVPLKKSSLFSLRKQQ